MDTITVTPTSATSPKLEKKHSVGDIRYNGSVQDGQEKLYGCAHLKGLLEHARHPALDQYARLVGTIRGPTSISIRLPKSNSYTSISLKPTYLCLQCPNVATAEQRGLHKKDHLFTVESSNGFLYCQECKDFIYDPALEEIRSQNGQSLWLPQRMAACTITGTHTPAGKKRKFSNYISDVDSRILSANSLANPCRATGLRGLYNMGQTCFMSVVLQSLIHNPFIRSYYLSEGHRSTECEREACTSCALDDIFTEFHSTEKAEGYGAVAMLQGSWKGGGNLAGYQQQDAHEYLQFILNNLHSANTEDDEEHKAEDCSCIIHRTFCGLLRSTVTCSKCKNVTTALDPFMDLSVDVKSQSPKKKKDEANGVQHSPAIDLTDCLDRFTSAEMLPAAEYKCTRCDSQQIASKRLSLSRLPPVLPIHLKRFSHSKTAATSIKLDTKVHFPLSLDMGPYTSRFMSPASDDKGKPQSHATNGESATLATSRPIYDLSSVVVHKGKMDSGHYVSYARVSGEWFMFDDSKVVLVDEKEVLGVEAYMLFYIVREIEA